MRGLSKRAWGSRVSRLVPISGAFWVEDRWEENWNPRASKPCEPWALLGVAARIQELHLRAVQKSHSDPRVCGAGRKACLGLRVFWLEVSGCAEITVLGSRLVVIILMMMMMIIIIAFDPKPPIPSSIARRHKP